MRTERKALSRGAVVVAALAIAILAWTAVAHSEGPVKLLPPPSWLTLETRFAPKAVPATVRAPITLHLSGEVLDSDGTHPAPLRELALEFDRNIAIDARGLPGCPLRRLRSHGSEEIRGICKDAIVGEGDAVVEFAYPENSPIPATSDLIVINGGHKEGVTTLYAHFFSPFIPSPKAIVMPLEIHKVHHGRYGTRAVLEIPELGSGYGSLISFDFGLNRRLRGDGEPTGVVSLKCPDGRFQILAEGTFDDGTSSGGVSVNPCTPKPPAPVR